MNREIEFYVDTIDDIEISSDTFNGQYNGKRLFAGYEGEDEATRLSFTFSTDFDNYTVTLLMNDVEVSLTVGDYYDIPSTYTIPEIIFMQIKAVYGGQTLLSRPIYLEIKR